MSANLNPGLPLAGGGGDDPLHLPKSPGVWAQAWKRLKADRVGMASGVVVLLFVLLIIGAQFGIVAKNWQNEVGVPFAPPHFVGKQADASQTVAIEVPTGPNADLSAIDPLAPKYQEWSERAARLGSAEAARADTLPFGGDRLGRDVLDKAIKGAEISIFVGLAAALVATLIGTLLGALAGYFGGRLGDILEWVYNVKTSIPYILLIFSLAAILKAGPLAKTVGNGIWTVVIILAFVGWTGIYRLVRAEYMKHRTREYVRAAEAIGASHATRMFVHILPNVSHVILVQLSLYVVAFIKAEVILSFLGLGVPVDMVSWGTMLSEAQTELVLGKWWQLALATVFMATFVTAFSLLTDALRDALDPKLR
jgi:peptide/nickel transport system permease protein